MFMRVTTLVVSLIAAGTQASGPWKWDAESDRVNRYEGLVSVESANPEFELLSFTGGVESFPAATQLKVDFFLPQNTPVLLLAQELQEDRYYRMEAKPGPWSPSAWNTFAPWDTATVIDPKNVAHDNIGVVVHLSADVFASGPIAPAFVYHTATTRQTAKYRVVIRARSTMARVIYTVTTSGATAPVVNRTLEGDFIRDTPIDLDIDTAKLNAGANVLAITCVPTSANAVKIERRYTFVHQK
jgi:hypothetical protein